MNLKAISSVFLGNRRNLVSLSSASDVQGRLAYVDNKECSVQESRNQGKQLVAGDLATKLLFASLSASLDSSRAYSGQPHTFLGQRGTEQVVGLTVRDICDCVVRGFALASGPGILYDMAELNEVSYSDLYDLDFSDLDPIAALQNIACELEKAMGIYPNVEQLIPSENVPTQELTVDPSLLPDQSIEE